MQSRVIVVLMVDGLRARALGAYGNTGFATSSIDRLASEGVVFDRCLAESTHLAESYNALWLGNHANQQSTPAADEHLIDQLTQQGYLCHLVTDDPTVAGRSDTDYFEEVTLVESFSKQAADEVFDTSMGRVLEAAADILGQWSAEYEQPRLLWVHLRGLTAPWDAPLEFAESLVDEDDPNLPASIEVPDQVLDAAGNNARTDEAADESFLASCRYAGQVMAFDQCIGALDNLLVEMWPEVPPTMVLGSTRGFALGEHGRLGTTGSAYREMFHVPLIIRGEIIPTLTRNDQLIQTSDLHYLFAALAADKPPSPTGRSLAAGESDGSYYLETDDWQLVASTGDGVEANAELFVQPDDQWQANDIASRCPAELEQLEQLAAEVKRRAVAGEAWHDLTLSAKPDNALPDNHDTGSPG